MLLPAAVSLAVLGALGLFLRRSFVGRAIAAVAQDREALRLLAIDPVRIRRVAFGLSIALAALAGGALVVVQAVDPWSGEVFIGRVFAIVIMGGLASLSGTVLAALIFGVVEKSDCHGLRPFVVPGRRLRSLAIGACRASGRPIRPHGVTSVSTARFWLSINAAAFLLVLGLRVVGNEYVFFAG